MKAEGRNTEDRRWRPKGESCALRWFCCVIAIVISGIGPSNLFADGGTLRFSQHVGNLQVSVFTSPAILRVGMIDVSVLIQDAATGKVRTDVPSVVRLQSTEDPNVVVECSTNSNDATNKLFRAALMEVPRAGDWKVTVLVGKNLADDEQTPADRVQSAKYSLRPKAPEFQLAVGPPLPPWLEIAPWICWPFAVAVLFLTHQSMKSRWLRIAAVANESIRVNNSVPNC